MRIRTRGSLVQRQIAGMKIWESCANSSWFTNPPFNVAVHGNFEEVRDIVTPLYNKRVAAGEVFFNPFQQKRYISYEPAGSAALLEVKGTLSCSGVIHHPMYTSTSTNIDAVYNQKRNLSPESFPMPNAIFGDQHILDMQDEASTRVLSERGRGDSSSNLFETLAEGRKSLAMVPDIMKNIGKIVSKAERSVKASRVLGKKVKTAADLYLTYRYGIRPLMMDLQNIVGSLEKKIGHVRKTTRGFVNDNTSLVEVLSTTGIGAQKILVQTDDTVSVRAMSLDEYTADLASNAGLSFKNLATVSWELVPYSFVVDWFVNVGDFLGAFAPSPGYKQLGGCIVTERVMQHTVSAYGNIPDGTFNIISHASGSFETYYITKVRTQALAAPRLILKNNFRLDEAKRAADAVALLVQRIKSWK